MMSTAKGKKAVKIMVFGTFDGLHPGHIDFFRQAKQLSRGNSFLIVSIARDQNVLRIKKRLPVFSARERKILVAECELVDKVVLAGTRNHIPHIVKERPDVIALGYDQRGPYNRNLKKDLQNKGIIVKVIRLKPYKKNIYKNSLLKRKGNL